MGPKTDLSDDPETVSYAFEVKGDIDLSWLMPVVRREIDPQGLFSEAQLAWYEKKHSRTARR